MDINQSLKYHCSRVGQKFGPFTGAELVQLAHEMQLLPTDHIWREGMPSWESASAFSSLTPIFAANHARHSYPSDRQRGHQSEFSANSATHRPAQNHRDYDPDMQENPIAAQITGRIGLPSKSGGDAGLGLLTPKDRKRRGASFGFLLFTHVLSLLGLLGVVGLAAFAFVSRDGEKPPGLDFLMDHPDWCYAAAGVMIFGGFLTGILTLVYLHRAWAHIQDLPNVFTTPGKAVFLLFIPLFNIVWLFFAFYNWAGDYNLRCALSNHKSDPKVSEGLFLCFCIFSVLGLPFLYIFMMRQMCRAINHLATAPKLTLAPSP